MHSASIDMIEGIHYTVDRNLIFVRLVCETPHIVVYEPKEPEVSTADLISRLVASGTFEITSTAELKALQKEDKRPYFRRFEKR